MEDSNKLPFVSVIIPVKNAEKYLPRCLQSLNNLNYPKDRYEVILSDSDSKDRTRQIAETMGVAVISADGESVCAGRNSGFKHAKGDIIAFSDADCVMDRDWLINAVKYFEDENVACVGGVSLTPPDETDFGKACGFIFSFSLFTGGSPYGLNFTEIREVNHNPGCNAIYRRSALEKVMPVDECFTEGEDVIMNKRIKDMRYKFLFTPDTRLWHYRSSNPKRFFRQNFKYGIGRVLMGKAYKELLNPAHIIAGFSIPILIIVFLLLLFLSPFVLAAGIIFFLIALAFFSILAFLRTKSFQVALNVPYAIALLLSGWSLGFMKKTFFPKDRENK